MFNCIYETQVAKEFLTTLYPEVEQFDFYNEDGKKKSLDSHLEYLAKLNQLGVKVIVHASSDDFDLDSDAVSIVMGHNALDYLLIKVNYLEDDDQGTRKMREEALQFIHQHLLNRRLLWIMVVASKFSGS